MKNIMMLVLLGWVLLGHVACSLLQVPQNCTLKVRSSCGTPTSCDSDAPFPLSMTVVVKITQRVKWFGADSWKYAIQDANKNLTALTSGCISGQPQPAEYMVGANLTLNLVCNQLPRELRKGDKLWVFVFSDKDNPDLWLMLNIPIQGITSSKQAGKASSRAGGQSAANQQVDKAVIVQMKAKIQLKRLAEK